MNDGKVGTALIQEYRFNQYCERLQRLIMQKLDDEFKMFMKWRGFNIDNSIFDIVLGPPQNFASYRQAEMDTSRVSTFGALEQLPYMSKRFLMERYLGLSQEEITENAKLWKEERDEPDLQTTQGQDLRSIGITPAGMESDIQAGEALAAMPPEGSADVGAVPGAPPGPGTAPSAVPPPPTA
jgi:hypothetical protein